MVQDYGRHKGHQHNLLELEAEKVRSRMVGAMQQMKKFMEEMSETNRRLEQVREHFPYRTILFLAESILPGVRYLYESGTVSVNCLFMIYRSYFTNIHIWVRYFLLAFSGPVRDARQRVC